MKNVNLFHWYTLGMLATFTLVQLVAAFLSAGRREREMQEGLVKYSVLIAVVWPLSVPVLLILVALLAAGV